MKQEILWLVYTVVMTGLMWVPYVLNRLREMGMAAMSQPNADVTPRAAWAKRMTNAHKNAVENLVIFAPLVLALQCAGVASTSTTVTACMVYFWARLAHFVGYSAGVPFVRTLSFTTGWACQMVLAKVLVAAL